MARKQEEKKRGLPPIQLRLGDAANPLLQNGWLGGMPGGGLFGGGNFAAGLGTLGGKIAVALLLSAIGAGAFGVGKMMAPRDYEPGAVARVGAPHDVKSAYQGDGSNLPGAGAGSGSMQVIPESLDGKTEAQRAAEEAAARAEAERQARAQQEAPPPSIPVQAAIPAMPATPAEGELNAKKTPFSAKFGTLSKFGAGTPTLNGGSGLSGGIGRTFNDKVALAQSRAMANVATGRIQSRAAPSNIGGRGRGFTYRQLDRSAGLSRGAASASGETGSSLASSAFEGSRVSGQVITGGGAGSTPIGGAGATTGGPTQAASSTNDGTQAAPEASHSNTSPWKMMAMAAVGAMALGGLLLTVASQMIAAGKKAFKAAMAIPEPAAKTAAIAAAKAMIAKGKMIAMIAAALGAMAMGIGMAMWKQFHQKQYGMVFLAGGGIIVAIAAMIMMRSDDGDAEEQVDGAQKGPADEARAQVNDGANGNLNIGREGVVTTAPKVK